VIILAEREIVGRVAGEQELPAAIASLRARASVGEREPSHADRRVSLADVVTTSVSRRRAFVDDEDDLHWAVEHATHRVRETNTTS